MNNVVVITGPTATGKSTLAVSLAEQLGGEIVNADSMQVYKGMDIGTAKPSVEVRERIPHHLFDICEVTERFSAGAVEANNIEIPDWITLVQENEAVSIRRGAHPAKPRKLNAQEQKDAKETILLQPSDDKQWLEIFDDMDMDSSSDMNMDMMDDTQTMPSTPMTHDLMDTMPGAPTNSGMMDGGGHHR